MKKALLLLGLLPLFLTACTTETKSDNGEELALNLVKDETYVMDQSADMTIDQTVQGQDVSMDMTMGGRLSFNVTNVIDGVYDMDVKYEHVRLSMKNTFMDLSIDTDIDDTEQPNMLAEVMDKVMKGMIGIPFKVKMDKHGNIKEVTGVEEMFGKAFDAVAEKDKSIDPQSKATAMAQLRQSYGSEAFKSNFETFMNIYPEEPVKVNDTWNKNIALNTTVTGTFDVEYKLNEIVADQYLVSADGTFTTDSSGYRKMNGMDMNYNMTGTYKAELKLNKATGWIEDATINQVIDGTVNVKATEQMPDGLSIPMKLKTTSTIK